MQQWRLDRSEVSQVTPPEVPHPDKSILILFPLCHSPGTFKALDANPGGTLELFDKYVQHIKLILEVTFELTFQKADGTPYATSDKEKKAMLLFRGGDDMKDLFEHVGAVTDIDTFNDAVMKIRTGLQGRTNNVVQRKPAPCQLCAGN